MAFSLLTCKWDGVEGHNSVFTLHIGGCTSQGFQACYVPPSSILDSPLMCFGFTDVTKELSFHCCAMCSSSDEPDCRVERGGAFLPGTFNSNCINYCSQNTPVSFLYGKLRWLLLPFPPKTSYFKTLISRHTKRTFLPTWAKHPTTTTLSLLWTVNSC